MENPNLTPESHKPHTPFYVRLAHRLRIAFPLLLLALAFTIELIEEIQGTHIHFGPQGPHDGFYLEIFAFGILAPLLVGLGFHWIAKVVEQLEAARANEEALRRKVEANDQSRRNLLAATIQQQEAERQRVARELHDGIGQPLTAFLLTSKINLEAKSEDPLLAHARRAATNTLDSMRRLILDLRPSLLDQQGLLPALRQCANDTLTPAGINVSVTAVGQPRPIPDEVKTALFRIGQESFTNILRHAQAQNAAVQLKYTPDHLIFVVSDDGQGFDIKTNNSNSSSLGLGLLSMKERTEQIGGYFEMESQPGNGAKIMVTIQLASQEGMET